MIAGNLLEIIFGHAFNGFFTLFFQWAERRNMKTTLDPVNSLTTGNLFLTKIS